MKVQYGKEMANHSGFAQVGFQANRRVLDVERLSQTASGEKKRRLVETFTKVAVYWKDLHASNGS